MTNTLNPTAPVDLGAAALTLAENLAHSLPVAAYQRAAADLRADPEASGLLERYSQAVGAWRAHQARGEASPEEAQAVQALQQSVRANAIIGGYANAQQAALAYVREINREISQLVGFDFGALARRAGCC